MCISGGINSIAKWDKSASNGARKIEFGSFGGEKERKHTGVGFVEISKIFATQGTLFFGMMSFERVCWL